MNPARYHISQGLESCRKAAAIIIYVILLCAKATHIHLNPLYNKERYHTSVLTGVAWVEELLEGHEDRIYHELGMQKDVFLKSIEELRVAGMTVSC
jgi:hypothetical protein